MLLCAPVYSLCNAFGHCLRGPGRFLRLWWNGGCSSDAPDRVRTPDACLMKSLSESFFFSLLAEHDISVVSLLPPWTNCGQLESKNGSSGYESVGNGQPRSLNNCDAIFMKLRRKPLRPSHT